MMIDCHSHILPGIDDGAQNLGESLAMARQAVDDGITSIICTPHANSTGLEETLAKRDEALRLLRDQLAQESIPLELIPGCEYYADGHSMDAAVRTPQCRLGTREDAPILVELPPDVELPLIADLNFLARTRGIQLILAHPTRYNGFLHNIDLLRTCMDQGLWLQFNAAGTTRGFLFYRPVPKAVLTLIRHNPEQILIGSDAHDPSVRTERLSDARRVISDALGEDTWIQISERNPKRRITA